MSLISRILKPVAGAAALTTMATVAAQPAQAFKITFMGSLSGASGLTSSIVPSNAVITFDTTPVGTAIGNAVPATPPGPLGPFTVVGGTVTYSAADTSVGRIVQGSLADRYRAPGTYEENPSLDPAPDNLTNYLTLGSPLERGPVSIKFSGADPLNYFGLYMGSIDTYNSIEFLRGGVRVNNGLIGGSTIMGLLRAAVNNPNLPFSATSAYVNFFAKDASQYFDEIVLISEKAALESDNHAFRAVPTPALVPAALGFGVAMLRKRKKEAGVKA